MDPQLSQLTALFSIRSTGATKAGADRRNRSIAALPSSSSAIARSLTSNKQQLLVKPAATTAAVNNNSRRISSRRSEGTMSSSKGEAQPLLKSGADVKPVYCVPRQGSIGNAADVS